MWAICRLHILTDSLNFIWQKVKSDSKWYLTLRGDDYGGPYDDNYLYVVFNDEECRYKHFNDQVINLKCELQDFK